jgi:hypothetical protein
MNRGLLVALVALALTPAVRDVNDNPDARSARAETSRAAPIVIAQRCFNTGGGVRCF